MRYLLFFLFVFVSPLLAGERPWAAPEGFFSEETIERKPLAPGLEWIAAKGKLDALPQETQILNIDLERLSLKPLVGSRLVPATAYFPRSRVSTLRAENHALAAINATFFDIRATQTPSGLLMKQRRLLRNPETGKRPTLFFNDRRIALAENVTLQATVLIGNQPAPLDSVNAPSLATGQIGLFVAPWQRTPGSGFRKEAPLFEIVAKETEWLPATTPGRPGVLKGRVSEIRKNQPSRPLQPGEFVLATVEQDHPVFRQARTGNPVEITWTLQNTPGDWTEWSDALSGGPVLFRGETETPFKNDARHPRTAVGINREGTRVLLVVVDGRSAQSAGMLLDELRRYLRHLGAWEAVNLDGGGSSTITAIVEGTPRLLNRPSDGKERFVPVGLGVFGR